MTHCGRWPDLSRIDPQCNVRELCGPHNFLCCFKWKKKHWVCQKNKLLLHATDLSMIEPAKVRAAFENGRQCILLEGSIFPTGSPIHLPSGVTTTFKVWRNFCLCVSLVLNRAVSTVVLSIKNPNNGLLWSLIIVVSSTILNNCTAVCYDPCRKQSVCPSATASLFIHQLVILRDHYFIILLLLTSSHMYVLSIFTIWYQWLPHSLLLPPGLTLLVGRCLGEQAELFLRTGASFLTLTESLLPGDTTHHHLFTFSPLNKPHSLNPSTYPPHITLPIVQSLAAHQAFPFGLVTTAASCYG